MKGSYFLFLVAILSLLGGLSTSEGAQVKVSHASPNLGIVKVLVNSTVVLPALHYQQISDYLPLKGGTYSIELQTGTETVLTHLIKIDDEKSYTLAAIGLYQSSKAPLQLLTLEDNNEAPETAHYTRIRLVHASPGLSSVDLRFEEDKWFGDVSYGDTTKYKSVRAGTYPIEFFVSGDRNPVLSFVLSLKGGEVLTIFLEGTLKDKSVEPIVTEDASFSYFRMRVSHAAADVQGVDVILDDGKQEKTLFSNVKFTEFTKYSRFVLGDYTIKIAPTGTKHAVVSQKISSKNINPETDYTLVVAGLAQSSTLQTLLLQDENFPPTNAGEAFVRFVHASPGIPALDFRINGQTVFQNVPFLTSTKYQKLRGIECQFEVFSAGTEVPLLSFTHKLQGGEIYSIFIEGLLQQKTLQQVVVQDAGFQFLNLRFSHAAPDVDQVDVEIDDGSSLKTLFQKVKFGEFTTYRLLVLQNYNLKISSAGLPRRILANVIIHRNETEENGFFTLNLLGLHRTNSLEGYLLKDRHEPPQRSTAAQIRFFHASPGTPPLDLTSSGEVWFHDVAFKDATDYKTVRAGTYNIFVRISGERVSVFNLTLNLQEGRIYSLYAEELLKMLKGVIHEDVAYNFITLRMTHSSPDSPAVDVLLDDGINQRRAFKDLKFGQISSYEFMVLTEFTILVTPVNKRFPVLLSATAESLCLTPDSTRTISIVGLSAANSLEFSVLADQNEAPTSAQVGHVRFYHVSPGSPALDFRIGGKLWFYHLQFTNATIYRRVPTGSYDCHVFLSGERTPVLNFTLVVKGGSINTVFLEGVLKSLKAIISVDAAYSFFTLRAAHASPDSPSVDLLLDDGTKVKQFASGLQFGKFTSYHMAVRANYKVLVTSAGEDNTVLFSYDLKKKNIDKNGVYTLAIVGLSKHHNDLDAVVLKDNNAAPTEARFARIRLFHASPDAKTIDVRSGDDYWARDLDFKEETHYMDVDAGNHEIEILSGGNVVVKLHLWITGGRVYSLFLEGVLDDLHVVTQEDASYSYFQLKVAHVSPTSPALDIYLDDDRIFENIGAESFSRFTTLVKKDYTLKITQSGSSDAIITKPLHGFFFKPNYEYVLMIMGLWGSHKSPLDVVLSQEQIRPPEMRNETLFRFVHAAPSFHALDARFNDLPIFLNSAYRSVSPLRSLVGKNYHIGVYGAGKLKDPILWDTYNLKAGKVYTVYAEEDSDSRIKLLVDEEESYGFVRFRITHASSDLGGVDLYLNNKKIYRDLKFEHSTPFLEYLKGTKNLKVRPHNALRPVLFDKNLDFETNVESSLVLTGCHKKCDQKIDAVGFANNWEFPASTKSYLRVFHALPFASRVDIKLNQHLVFANIAYGHPTNYELTNSGAYLIQIFEAGTSNELAQTTVHLDDQIYTLFFAGHSKQRASAFMLSDYSRDPFSFVRFLHASPDTSHIDVQLDREGQFWDVPFGEGSKYKQLPAGRYDVSVSLARQVAYLAKLNKISISPYTHTSLILHGLSRKDSTDAEGSSSLGVIQLEDDIDLPQGNFIKVRFVHAVPDLGKIDLIANGRLIFANVSYTEATHYLNLEPADYTLTFSKPSGLTLSGGTLRAGNGAVVYTIVAEGLSKSDPPTMRAVAFVDFEGPTPPKASKRMSPWKVVLIVIGSVVGLGLIILAGYLIYRRRRTGQYQTIS